MDAFPITIPFLVTLCCMSSTSGDEISDFQALNETQMAQFLDSVVQPPPRTGGFETLVLERDVKLFCFRPSSPYRCQVFLSDKETSIREKIDLSRPLVIMTHGWTQSTSYPTIRRLTSQFRRYVNDVNLCLLDWEPYGSFTYEIAARRSSRLVASWLSRFLMTLRQSRYAMENVSLIGNSMGGHIMAYVGKALGGEIGALFALDPAGPLFTHPRDLGPTLRLTSTDARYVQLILTSRYLLGVGEPLGTQNFLPNGGLHPQRPCSAVTSAQGTIPTVLCSHEYAVQESLEFALLGRKWVRAAVPAVWMIESVGSAQGRMGIIVSERT